MFGPLHNFHRFGEAVRLSARRPELLGVLVGVLRLAPKTLLELAKLPCW
jgi:hypothetical protein